MVWQPNILNNCYGLLGGYAPPKSPWTPLGDFRSPDPLCLPPPNPGYATESGVAVATNLERSYWLSEISYTSLDMIVVEESGPLRPRTVGKQVSSRPTALYEYNL